MKIIAVLQLGVGEKKSREGGGIGQFKMGGPCMGQKIRHFIRNVSLETKETQGFMWPGLEKKKTSL
jgi:hypothetical protein